MEASLQHPAFATLQPFLSTAQPFAQNRIAERLNNLRVASEAFFRFDLCFQAQSELVDGLGYEERIATRGIIATRDNWHDWFNGLVWLRFPNLKNALIKRHVRYMRNEQERGRGAIRDAATLFDENGLIVLTADPMLGVLLREFQWQALFVEQRAKVIAGMKFLLVGHGLYEKLLQPYPAMTAHSVILQVSQEVIDSTVDEQCRYVDGILARLFYDSLSFASTKVLAPLPVMGIPGWNPANEAADFYNDTNIFRRGRRDGKEGLA